MENIARRHHYAPQFFLRNFANDGAKKKISVVAKHDSMAVWSECSIESIAYEDDFYVHIDRGVPVSVEEEINNFIETPISQSDTWRKISGGCSDLLDISDKPTIYALIRHFEARTPHYLATIQQLAEMSSDPDSAIPFTGGERLRFSELTADASSLKKAVNSMASTTRFIAEDFHRSGLTICRSPITLRSSTTPVCSMPAPAHPALSLPLPGMRPYQLVLTLNPNTIACLVFGDFDNGFMNCLIDEGVAAGFNRHYVAQFAQFDSVRHIITGREDLSDDMTWAPYDLIEDTPRKIIYRRR